MVRGVKKAEVEASATLPHKQTDTTDRETGRQTERRTERQRDSQTQKQPERPARETARDRLCRETETARHRNSQSQDSQRQTAYWEEVCVWPFHLTALDSVLDQLIAA